MPDIEKFIVSMPREKDVLYILSSSEKKGEIMQAINSSCGVETEAKAVCFSMPVSDVVGFRNLDEDTL